MPNGLNSPTPILSVEHDLESGLRPSDSRKNHPAGWASGQFCRNVTLASIPIAAILIFLSKPIMAFMSRESCYFIRGEADFSNPISGMWYAGWSLYKCEWAGYFGFNWTSVLEWLSDKGYAFGSSLGVVGGLYASWKTFMSSFGRTKLSNDERERVKELTRHIEMEPEASSAAESPRGGSIFLNPRVFRISQQSKLKESDKPHKNGHHEHKSNSRSQSETQSRNVMHV